MRAHEPPSQLTEMRAGGCEIDFVVNLERFARPVVSHFVFQANPVVPGTTDMSFAFHVEVVIGANVDPKCALDRWPPAISSAAKSAHDLKNEVAEGKIARA